MSETRSSRTRVGDLVESLRRHYWNGVVEADSPFASTRQIAGRFHVSPVTADRAINVLVEKGYLYRREKSGTFYSDVTSRKLRIGIATLPSYQDPARQKALDMTVSLLRSSGADLKFIYFQELRNQEIGPGELENLDGLLISYNIIDPETWKALKNFRHPIAVLFSNYIFPDYLQRDMNIADIGQFNCCALDMTEACDQVVSLIEPNRKILIFYALHGNSCYRKDQFLGALTRGGIPSENIRMIAIPSTEHFGQGEYFRFFFDKVAEVRDKFVFCTSDVLSDIALNALNCQHLYAGRDFDWVGCDNLAKYGFGTPGLPALTTIDCNAEECAAGTVKILLKEIREPSEVQMVGRVKTKLVLRETVKLHELAKSESL